MVDCSDCRRRWSAVHTHRNHFVDLLFLLSISISKLNEIGSKKVVGVVCVIVRRRGDKRIASDDHRFNDVSLTPGIHFSFLLLVFFKKN